MQKTSIDYLTHSWGIFSGCYHWRDGVCGGDGSQFHCWAKAQVRRFPKLYPHGFEPTIYWERLGEPKKLKKPARIGVAFMGDLFGGWYAWGKGNVGFAPSIYIREILRVVRDCPQITFVFLTKRPENLVQFNPWPPNAWVGASVTSDDAVAHALYCGLGRVEAPVRFISFEPLLGPINVKAQDFKDSGVNWVILGGCSSPKQYPKREWVDEIEAAADVAGVAVYEKSNLFADKQRLLRREYPTRG